MKDMQTSKYNRWSITLHWLMLLLFVAVYLCIELRELYPRGSDMRNGLKNWHFVLGLCVWLLVVIRLWIRASYTIPSINPPPAAWQNLASRVVHLLLYLFMLIMPVLGYLTVSYDGNVVNLVGLQLPSLVGTNESIAETLESIHKWIGVAGYWLIGLHALAALYHHYILKDNTLKRMLP